jgi:hypothetical protein
MSRSEVADAAEQYARTLQAHLGADGGGGGAGGGGGSATACAPYATFLNRLTTACVPGSTTFNAGQCAAALGSVVGGPCGQLTCLADIAEQVGNVSADALCADVDRAVTALSSPAAASGQAARLLPWLDNTVAPCVETFCAGTAHPVRAAAIRAAPRTFVRNALMANLSPTERFALRYGWAVALAVFLLMLGVILWLAFRSSRLSEELRFCVGLRQPVVVGATPGV